MAEFTLPANSKIGVGDTFSHTRVGIFFGEPGTEVVDPYFGGEGPRRTGSSSSMISIARIFGAPVTLPPGNTARMSSTNPTSSRRVPWIVATP